MRYKRNRGDTNVCDTSVIVEIPARVIVPLLFNSCPLLKFVFYTMQFVFYTMPKYKNTDSGAPFLGAGAALVNVGPFRRSRECHKRQTFVSDSPKL